MCNKLLKQWDNVREPGDFEHPFHYCEGELKMEFRWDYEKQEPILLLDGTHHDLLPYIASTFTLDEQQVSHYRAILMLNGV